MADPIRAYWWNSKPNFGDAICPRLVEAVSGRAVEWTEKRYANFFGVGSLLRFAARRASHGDPMAIWGTGMIEPMECEMGPNVRVGSVRGPLSAECMGMESLPLGDPGLIVDRIEATPPRKHRLGIVPHHQHLDRMPVFAELVEQVPGATLIRVDEEDPWETVRQIASCEVIASSSLHGMIVADSYAIPNYYLAHNVNNLSVAFKFRDHALCVGRELESKITAAELAARVAADDHPDFGYLDGLAGLKDGIEGAFPV